MSSTRPSKRSRETAPETDESGDNDSNSRDGIIDLDVGGRLFRTSRSTLTNAQGSYFAARFGGGRISPGGSYLDEQRGGREVFFIDRDGDLFVHVLAYLRTHRLPHRLPSFVQDPSLWRALREEAEFYGLDGLKELLRVIHVCTPDKDGDRGMLYWLGTEQGAKEYRNPHGIGAVKVGGWFDASEEEMESLREHEVAERLLQCGSEESRRAFVGHHSCFSFSESTSNCLLFCGFAKTTKDATLDLRSFRLRPTHYSMRYLGYDSCYGFHFWNFEGSNDGTKWDILHAARGDTPLKRPSAAERSALHAHTVDMPCEEQQAFRLSYYEKNHRRIWSLNPAPLQFYRHFRLVGLGEDAWGELAGAGVAGSTQCCMHTTGLELYGEVSES